MRGKENHAELCNVLESLISGSWLICSASFSLQQRTNSGFDLAVAWNAPLEYASIQDGRATAKASPSFVQLDPLVSMHSNLNVASNTPAVPISIAIANCAESC
jgi:hypothetical protein